MDNILEVLFFGCSIPTSHTLGEYNTQSLLETSSSIVGVRVHIIYFPHTILLWLGLFTLKNSIQLLCTAFPIYSVCFFEFVVHVILDYGSRLPILDGPKILNFLVSLCILYLTYYTF